MNEIARRMIMMIGIVLVGTILIFIDAPVHMTLVATLAFGIVMAMGLGVLKIEDLKAVNPLNRKTRKNPEKSPKEKKNKKEKSDKKGKESILQKQIISRFKKDTKDSKDKPAKETKKNKDTRKEKSRLSAGLSASIASFQGRRQKARDEKHSEKIDSLLTSAIEEPVTPSTDVEDSQEVLSLQDNSSDLSDEFGSFDEKDFESLNSLEIDGEELSLDTNSDFSAESHVPENNDSLDQNLDDEIHSILLAENALDPEDNLPEEPLVGQQNDDASISSNEDSFDSDVFFVQGIEDGLDEKSFISIPEIPADTQSSNSLTETLDELDNLPGFEKSYPEDDEFSDFQSINLDELDADDLYIETDEIIIEDEEIDETGVLPDDFIPESDEGNSSTKGTGHTGSNGELFENTEIISPEIDTAISFSGKGEYDDILSVLESDIKKTKTGPEPSLVRDMKDVSVDAKDLVEELETVLTLMGGQKNQHSDQDVRRNK